MRRRYIDLTERVAWTFVQGFFAEWLVTQSLDEQTLQVAALAGVAAVAKCLLAFRVGAPTTAAWLPVESDTERSA